MVHVFVNQVVPEIRVAIEKVQNSLELVVSNSLTKPLATTASCKTFALGF